MKMILEFDSLAEAQEWARTFAALSPTPTQETDSPLKPNRRLRRLVDVSAKHTENPTKKEADTLLNAANERSEPPVVEAEPEVVPPSAVKGLGKRQKEALDVLVQHAGQVLTTGEAAMAVGVKSTAMSNILRGLSERGLATSPSRGKWTLLVTDADKVAVAPEPTPEPITVEAVDVDEAPPVTEVEDTAEEEPQMDPQTLLNQKTEDILNGLDL